MIHTEPMGAGAAACSLFPALYREVTVDTVNPGICLILFGVTDISIASVFFT